MLTKSTLLRSSRDLFYKYGVKSVSMDDIARLLGISKKTIYKFIENKKDLVMAVVTQHLNEEKEAVEMIKVTAENAIDEMTSIARLVLESLRSIKPTLSFDLKKYHPGAWSLIEKDHFNYIENVIKINIERGISEKYYRANIDPNIYSKLYVGLAKLIVNQESFPPGSYALSELYENVIHYHIHGIMNDKGKKAFNKYLKKVKA